MKTIDKNTAAAIIRSEPAPYIVSRYNAEGNLEIGIPLNENDGISDITKKIKLDAFVVKHLMGKDIQMFFGEEKGEVYRYIFQIQ